MARYTLPCNTWGGVYLGSLTVEDDGTLTFVEDKGYSAHLPRETAVELARVILRATPNLPKEGCESELRLLAYDGPIRCQSLKGHEDDHERRVRTTVCPVEEEPSCGHDVVIRWRGSDRVG